MPPLNDFDKNLKIVFRSAFIHEMHIAKAKFENEEINSFVIDEHFSYTIGTAFIEEYKLMEAWHTMIKHIPY